MVFDAKLDILIAELSIFFENFGNKLKLENFQFFFFWPK